MTATDSNPEALAFDRIVAAMEDAGCKVDEETSADLASDLMIQCPAHNDGRASLHVTAIEGQTLMYCFAGCDTVSVLDAIGMSLRDMYDSPAGATYVYEDGRRVLRKPDKKFSQSGNTKGTSAFYRLSKVRDAVGLDVTVYLVEGEKDVHTLEAHGCVATTAPMGSGNFNKVDVEPLRGARVIAVQDNDDAGRKWASQVREALDGVAESLEFRTAASGKDATDHLMAGHSMEDLALVPADTRKLPITVDVADQSMALAWLKREIGQGALSGILRRGESLVHTPRIGEAGYLAPKSDKDSLGPAQVRRIDALQVAGRVDHGYNVVSVSQKGIRPTLFPQTVASRATANPDLLANVRDLRGVTHTPMVNRDGTVLDTPGYDEGSQMLYLPDPGLDVPKVAEEPSAEDVSQAGKLLLYMIEGFPFVTVHDRANYLGLLLTPLLRQLAPPPYKLCAIGAAQRGSGKSKLARIARDIHGGVFKSEMPSTDDELRKFVTSTLDATTGPVVQFDNVTGVLKSSVLDGLLTSAEWSDRVLGSSVVLNLTNDRLWVVTGNNVHIGGDLERRTLWITIDPKMERPEERTNFAITDLDGWVAENRGNLLWALLTLIRAWVVAGSPEAAHTTSDDFGRWVAVVRGILDHAALGESVGVFGHADSVKAAADPDEDEWAGFLSAIYEFCGSDTWTTADLLACVWDQEHDIDGWRHDEKYHNYHSVPSGRLVVEIGIASGRLPGDIGDKWRFNKVGAAKSLGKWLSFRNGRWADGLSAQMVSDPKSKHAKLWRVVNIDDPEGLLR